jgi:hypothetical protein
LPNDASDLTRFSRKSVRPYEALLRAARVANHAVRKNARRP